MAVSKEKFMALFLDEFRENLLAAENQIIVLKNDQGNSDALALLLRTLHTIKGAARLLQFGRIERLVHGLENVFKGVREGRYAIDARLARFFFIGLDHLRFAAAAIQEGRGEELPGLEGLLEACEKISANEAFDVMALEPLPAVTPAVVAAAGPLAAAQAAVAPLAGPAASAVFSAGSGLSNQAIDASIRVDAATIDRSISLVNTLTVRQLRLRSGVSQLESLERHLDEAVRQGEDLRALRKKISGVSRQLRQYRNLYSDQLFEIEHGTHELRDAVISMRMLPLSTVLEHLPRMVEEAAEALGKDVRIAIRGDSVHLDRTVLSKLSDPLIHLVRNAIDHGIESPEERSRAGKPAWGLVEIDCRTEGNRISVTIRDDGRGLDYESIRQKAISLWPENAPDIKLMGNDELVRFLFRAGFSTRSSSTTLSGRGIGLDIVKTNIEAAKGQIQLDSAAGVGCTFTLLLPVSASTMDGMFVLAAGSKYYIPSSAITRTLLLDSTDVFHIRQKEMFALDGLNIAISDLSVCLQLDRRPEKAGKVAVLLVRGASDLVGLRVDKILGYDSLVYQSLPASLRRNTLIQGVVFDSAFDIIPILNMWAVLDRLRSVRLMDTHKRFSSASQLDRPSILVVDDSISTREIEVSMLSLEGYDVIGAVDGVDALEKIHAMRFDLIVSDLNMPRMDGMKLLENIRNDEATKATPVILVTTVDEAATKARAEALGVSKYILKSSFEQDNLISSVRQLLAALKEPRL
ncbi:MAG: hypothetical protein A2087_12615 [Spirochaetes bacterium GWD1_61_31]|nr:MAG: hypothetical protein A2Y37_11395 [Spirochaetes bacterium GWB1_60_80]OHD32992.1 MAG: hypothetical protein A2004_07285 [Spirochaetes bacterium GWC1_61_12]OHD38359.1 MAG: hypothetical protein A2087_12615 [Spirochaetes bacterium GWD1_61_31]OHD43374.1 MAG: hypothetical protein A2Y35_02165 [Spirochaetes bacterium GWE1_60_18]OHD58905.1 MAG: hypothetical protein A2Y32_10605 [Spirochaetes bacterium GWF1_60_12]